MFSFVRYIASICIFLIFAESILHFVAGEQYQKYVKLLVNIMVLSQFILPVKAIITGGETIGISQQIEDFQQKIESHENTLGLEETELGIYDSVKEEMKIRLNQLEEMDGYQVTRIEFSKSNKESDGKEVSVEIGGIAVYVSRKNGMQEAGGTISVPAVKGISSVEVTLDKTGGDDRESSLKEQNGQELTALKKLFCSCLGTEERYMEVIWDE